MGCAPIATLTLISSFIGGANAANLVINGGFESTVGSSVIPPGWTVSGGSPTTPLAYTLNPVVSAYEGVYSLDLGPAGSDSSNGGTISQTISVATPGDYTFSFAYTNEENHLTDLADFSFSLSGAVSDTQTFNSIGGGYSTFSSNYNVSSSGNVTISFSDIIGNSHGTDAVIDSVSFNAVPEPSSTLLLGLGSLSLVLRRTRK